MTLTFEEFRQAIRVWMVDVIGPMEVIISHGTGPRPKGQYATLNVMSPSEKLIIETREDTRELNGDIRADYTGVRKIMVSVNIYRDDVEQKMINLKSSLSRVLIQDYFNGLDIGIIEPSEIRHIPEEIGKSWENRTQCDFFFHVVFKTTDANIGEIKQIEVTNEINGNTTIIVWYNVTII